jgi:hypothetical protein
MTKYQKTIKLMEAENPELWNSYKDIHEKFSSDQNSNRDEYNRIGEEFMAMVNKYNDDLCRTSEGSGYGWYSGGLAEKFMNELRVIFPNIDEIGIL